MTPTESQCISGGTINPTINATCCVYGGTYPNCNSGIGSDTITLSTNKLSFNVGPGIGPKPTTGTSRPYDIGLIATVLAYAVWGYLLRRHPAARVAPFALLVPFVAAAASALVLGERFGAPRLLGMALVLTGLAIIMRPSAGVTEPAAGSR